MLDMRVIRMAGSYLLMGLGVLQIVSRKEPIKGGGPHVLQSTTSSTASSSLVQVGSLSQFLDQ